MKRILMMFALCMMLGSLVGAYEFDNVKVYDAVAREVTITNFLGLGSEIGTARLNTPLNVKVGAGYQKVAELDISAYTDYTDAIKDFEFINLNDGKVIERQIDVKYKTIQEVLVDDFGNVCKDEFSKVNDTTYKNCYYEKIGSHYEKKEVWIDFPKEIKEGTYTIGLFTDVQAEDKVDWIPSIYGVKVEEWASWEASLSVNLIAYFKLDEVSGAVIDSTNRANGTNDGSLPNQAGKINTAYYLDNTGDSINISKGSVVMGTASRSVNMWVYLDSSVGNQQFFSYGNLATGNYWGIREHLTSGKLAFMDVGGADANSNFTLNTDGWVMVTAVFNGTTLFLYGNGSSAYMGTHALDTKDNYVPMIGCALGDSYSCGMVGKADELAIWNKTLTYSEIQLLWNGGTGLGYLQSDADAYPNITINSPTTDANYTTSPQNIIVNCTATDDKQISSVKLYVSGNLNTTNATGLNNTDYIFNLPLYDGDYNISCRAEDNVSQTTDSATRRIIIDSTPPTITVHSPINNTIYVDNYTTTNYKTVQFNWTATDLFLNTCWYFNGTANTTITCNTNQTRNLSYGAYNFKFYANDTFGNLRITETNNEWKYFVKQNSETYSTSVLKGESSSFILNVSYNDSEFTNSAGYLYYNGTIYTGTRTTSGSNYIFTKVLDIPLVSAQQNISFYWNITLNNGSNYYISSNPHNQTINALTIDDCSANKNVLLGFEVFDEKIKTSLNETEIMLVADINVIFYNTRRTTTIAEYSKSFNVTNPYSICLSNNFSDGQSYSMDLELQNKADSYSDEFYYIQNSTINFSDFTTNISIYLLNDSFSQTFNINYKDYNLLPISDALITIQRKYVGENLFRTVEISKTDTNGDTLGHLELNDVIYNFVITKNGVVLDSFLNKRAVCQTPTYTACEINLNSFASSPTMSDYTGLDDFSLSIDWNETTSQLSASYTIPSGNSQKVDLNITLLDSIGTTSICSDSLTSASGVLYCTIPSSYGNSTITALVSKAGTPVGRAIIKLNDEPSDIYGGSLVILAVFMFATLFAIGISDNYLYTLMFLMIGAIVGVALNFVDATGYIGKGATILWILIAIIVVAVKGARR